MDREERRRDREERDEVLADYFRRVLGTEVGGGEVEDANYTPEEEEEGAEEGNAEEGDAGDAARWKGRLRNGEKVNGAEKMDMYRS